MIVCSWRRFVYVFIFLFLWGVFAHPSKAQAATYTVTKTADTNDGTCDADCSLREAVIAANANSGFDTINFSIPTSDGGYLAASGSTQAYWTITINSNMSLTDNSGVFINGYTQSGSSRNSAQFGQTINTVLTLRLFLNDDTYQNAMTLFASNNNHVAGLNIVKKRSNNSSRISITSASNNWIEGNFFGSDITGTSTSGGNTLELITNSNNNVIGTNGDGNGDVGERNLFAGSENDASGIIQIFPGTASSNNNVIAGNYMGTSITGRSCLSAVLGRTNIHIDTSTGNRVGTNYDGVSDSEEANILGCVTAVYRATVRVLSSTNTVIQGNYIGVSPYGDALGTLVGTQRAQIGLSDGVITGTIIKGNTISNGAFGILCQINCTSNTFSQNSIFGNEFLGISLSPVTPFTSTASPNDSGDLDAGPNEQMNSVVLKSVSVSGSNVLVIADLDMRASEAPFTVEVFDNDGKNIAGRYEGKYFVGSVRTSQIGNAVTLTVPITGRTPTSAAKLTATITNTNGSTSEFSQATNDPNLYSSSFRSTLDLAPGTQPVSDGKVRLFGTARRTGANLTTVEYALNGGSFRSAVSTDGAFDEPIEDFYAEFSPVDPNYKGDGYVLQLHANNSNDPYSEPAFYFAPFQIYSPADGIESQTTHPTFTFGVNSQASMMKDNIDTFQIKVRSGIENTKAAWKIYGEAKPSDSATRSITSSSYTLTGAYQWKVVAVDKWGHVQETDTRKLFISPTATAVSVTQANTIPFSLLSVSGRLTRTPTLFGIAPTGSLVSATFVDQRCNSSISLTPCAQTFTTIADGSRYSISVPKSKLISGRQYRVFLNASGNGEGSVKPFLLNTQVGL